VHTDSRATESARSIHAKAYTIGQHVILGPGQDQLTTSQGKRLLAHELVHVLQQGSNGKNVDQVQLQEAPQQFPPAPVPPVTPPSLPPPQTGPPVYICWSPTEAAPIANHSWFRVGGPEPQEDHETFSLFPKIVKKDTSGSGCAQGVPVLGSLDRTDLLRPSSCAKTQLNLACVKSTFSTYPVGYYCPLGANSNTFTGATARACGVNFDPPAFVPGYDMSPPVAGTFGPDWTTMGTLGLLFCGPKECK
jgi:hypothetical protein